MLDMLSFEVKLIVRVSSSLIINHWGGGACRVDFI